MVLACEDTKEPPRAFPLSEMSTSTSTPPQQKHSRVLACVLCQHRKIKCDRNTPCSNCVKANVTCTPSVPAPARKRRRPNQDLQERLARCEELLKQYAGVPPPQAGSAAAAAATTTTQRSEPVSPERMDGGFDHPTSTTNTTEESSPWVGPGKMVKDESGVRFMDSYVWASIFDQLQEMKDIVETEDDDNMCGSSGEPSDRLTPENNTDLLLGVDASDKSLQELQPDPIHAFRLWQLFLDRVNPLLKIVHVPSLNPYVMEGAVNINNVPLNYQALLFAIYAIGTISLAEEEVPQILNTTKELAIRRYTSGLKLALIRFDLMKNHDMVGLQAMLIYLGRYDRHASWIISGTVVRMAQKMGYHRDGELLGLPPFETEMRRRIWWQILMIDVKYALMAGLNHSLLPVNWNTKEPSNINDADLFPGLNEHVQSKDGPTEMAFVLVMNQVAMFMLKAASNPTFEAAMMGEPLMSEDSQNSSDDAMSKVRTLMDDLVASLAEVERRFVDANAGPVHRSALSIRPLMAHKMQEMLISMEKPSGDGGIPMSRQDRLLRLLVLNIEHNVAIYENDGMREGNFLWYIKPHFQLEAFGVLTGMLAQKPLGLLADRAWASVAVAHRYHGELFDMTQKMIYQQALFTLKAWAAREQALRSTGQEVSTPEYIQRLKTLCPASESRNNSTHASVSPVAPAPPQLTELDSFFGSYVDMSQFQWDTNALWNQPDPSQTPSAAMDLGDFNMGNLSMKPNHSHMGQF